MADTGVQWLFIASAMFVLGSPLWLSLVFVAYAIGRQRYGMQLLFWFVTAEAISIALSIYWAFNMLRKWSHEPCNTASARC